MYREKDLARDSVFKRHRMGLELNLLSREHCSAALASASEGNETNLRRFRVKEVNFRMLCSNKREKEEEEEEEEESRRLFIEGKGRYTVFYQVSPISLRTARGGGQVGMPVKMAITSSGGVSLGRSRRIRVFCSGIFTSALSRIPSFVTATS